MDLFPIAFKADTSLCQVQSQVYSMPRRMYVFHLLDSEDCAGLEALPKAAIQKLVQMKERSTELVTKLSSTAIQSRASFAVQIS